MNHSRPLLLLAALILLVPQGPEPRAQDLDAFSSFSCESLCKPNIMIVFDTSMSMRQRLDGEDDDDEDPTDRKWYIARQALIDVVEAINPPEGGGGYTDNARFGLAFYDKSNFGQNRFIIK